MTPGAVGPFDGSTSDAAPRHVATPDGTTSERPASARHPSPTLAGWRVLVPQPPLEAGTGPGRTSPAAVALATAGAEPLVVPLVRTLPVDDLTPLDDALLALGAGWYGWLAVTSQAAVAVLAERAAAHDDGLAAVVARAGVRVAAVGPGTARALEALGVPVDVVPPVRSTAVDLVAALVALPDPGNPHADPEASGSRGEGGHGAHPVADPAISRSAVTVDATDDGFAAVGDRRRGGTAEAGDEDRGPAGGADVRELRPAARRTDDVVARRVLFPRGDLAAPTFADGLTEAGWHVDDLVVYRTVPAGPPDAAVARAWRSGDVHAALLTSASTVRALLDHLGPPPPATLVVVIGPSTEAEARRLGLRVDAVAARQTLAGLVAALTDVVTRTGATPGAAGDGAPSPTSTKAGTPAPAPTTAPPDHRTSPGPRTAAVPPAAPGPPAPSAPPTPAEDPA
ncbi:uroporphyrinogen-III synthase [Cellulomonas iranensis]|uniref:uroporphyrinogen-III synthase n=1 Tax=Cellulomonas iranensis TaxID=76862 RepID=UPI001CF5A1AD|nr:uroporphyrinogen-III synthase [Cellulomonas iranensis]UCN14905.1 uroporphyrinogen-III synthase [Cellulomonas iranensis]